MPLDDDWKPLQVRLGSPEAGMFDGIPNHLTGPLRVWVARAVSNIDSRDERQILLRLRINGDPPTGTETALERTYWRVRPPEKLAIIDALLFLCSERDQEREAVDKFIEELQSEANEIGVSMDEVAARRGSPPSFPRGWRFASDALRDDLRDGGSAFTVSSDGSELLRRVDPSAEGAVAMAISDATGAAGEHLKEAFSCCFRRSPDFDKSYSESIKAVESAGGHIVSPQRSDPQLGAMCKELAPRLDQFELAIPAREGMQRVHSMMELLMSGQVDRHGKKDAVASTSKESAEAAVFLATTLVQWFTSGAIRPIANPSP